MASATQGDIDMDNITPEQARAALDQAKQPLPATARSRRVHGLSVAGLGLLMGAYVAARAPLAEHINTNITWGVYAALALGIYSWQRRAASVMPQGVRRISFIGTGASTVLALIGIMFTEFRRAQAELAGTAPTHPWWLSLALVVIIAAPSLVAGHLIDRDGR